MQEQDYTDLDTELEGIHNNLLAQSEDFLSARAMHGLRRLMELGLEDPSHENRVAVLCLIAGRAMRQIFNVEIRSTKNLSQGIAVYLIGLFLEPDTKPWRLNEYGRRLLADCEARVKEQAFSMPRQNL